MPTREKTMNRQDARNAKIGKASFWFFLGDPGALAVMN
jgi:hypothetical protein